MFGHSHARRSFAPTLRRVVVLSLTAGAIITAAHIAHSTTGQVLIDSGGSGGKDADGHSWSADNSYVGGTVGATTATISGTRYQNIFRNWRIGMSAYHLAVANGTYTVKLLESEDYFNSAGKRVFTVTSEGVVVARNLDIWSKAGGEHKATYVVFSSKVTDGKLDLGFTASQDKAKVDGISLQLTSSSPSPTGSVMWGMNDSSSYDTTEHNLGRSFSLAREYRQLDDTIVTSRMKTLASSGHSLVLSVRAEVGTRAVKYSDITAGHYDSALLKGFAALNALPTRPFFIFQHEPESDNAKGACSSSTSDSVCGPQFVTAWKHIYNLAKSHGYTRPIFAWTVEGYSFKTQTNVRAKYYWVGNSYTDWVGVDQYNSNCVHNWWSSFTDMMQAAVQWLKANAATKSVIIPEYGAQEGSTSTAKPDFFKDIPSELTQSGYNKIRGLVYWNNAVSSSCNYKINTTTASYNAYKSTGLNTAMQMKAPT